MTDTPEPDVKPKRPRKTKAEREAARLAKAQAEAAKPLPAGFWGLMAGVLFFVTACFYIDILTLLNYRATSSSSSSATGEIVIFVLAIIYNALGKTWGTILFGIVALFCLYKAIQRRILDGGWNK